MAILRVESMPMHRIAHKLSSCSCTRESVQVYLSHALMFSIRWYLSIPHRLFGFASPANEDYCAVNSIAHNTVPVMPFAVHVIPPVDVFASNDAPFQPYAFHRSNSSHNLSTGNSTTLCSVWVQSDGANIMCFVCRMTNGKEKEKERKKSIGTKWRNNTKEITIYGYCDSQKLLCNLLK